MNTRIFIWINNRMYTTGSYKQAVEFCAMFKGSITSCDVAGKKDQLQYCGDL